MSQELVERGYHAAILRKGKLYIFGGVIPVYDNNNVQKEFPKHKEYIPCTGIHVYDINERKWTLKETTGITPFMNENSPVVLHRDVVFMFGGWNGQTHSNKMLTYTFETMTWQEEFASGKLPTPRAGHTMSIVSDDKFFLFGGQGPMSSHEDNEFTMKEFIQSEKYKRDVYNNQSFIYDRATQRWRLLQPEGIVPTPRAYHSRVMLHESLYIFGGRNHESNSMNELWRFNCKSFEWKCITPQDSILPPPFYRHTMNLLDTFTLLVYGGWEKAGKLSTCIWIYKVDGNCWKMISSSLIKNRSGHTTSTIENNSVLIYGGEICTEDKVRSLTSDLFLLKFENNKIIKSMNIF